MLHRIKPALPALLAVLAAAPVLAQDGMTRVPACKMTDDQSDCVRILACIGTEGLWFNGRAFGRGSGTLAGQISNGATCTGNWTARNALGLGQADVACDDGMNLRVLYTYQDEYTGTARGHGMTNRQELVKAWAGEHVVEYLMDQQHAEDENAVRLPCGKVPIPIS